MLARAGNPDLGLLGIFGSCIGAGIYGWPADIAAQLAFDAVVAHLNECVVQTRIIFCCFSRADRDRYAALIAQME